MIHASCFFHGQTLFVMGQLFEQCISLGLRSTVIILEINETPWHFKPRYFVYSIMSLSHRLLY